MTGRTDLLVLPHEPTDTSVPAAGGTGWLLSDSDMVFASTYERSSAA